jgi:hypothetical protein
MRRFCVKRSIVIELLNAEHRFRKLIAYEDWEQIPTMENHLNAATRLDRTQF